VHDACDERDERDGRDPDADRLKIVVAARHRDRRDGEQTSNGAGSGGYARTGRA
jgi:hypothetical protein